MSGGGVHQFLVPGPFQAEGGVGRGKQQRVGGGGGTLVLILARSMEGGG